MNLRQHPPERRRKSVTLAAHGCCCCCCCCLHSVGGLIGSAVASTKSTTDEARRTVKVYWISLLASTVLGVATFAQQENFSVALVVAALCLPAAQLMASFFTLCAGMFLAIDHRTLGRITWKGFLWGVVGFLIMAVPLMAMSYM